MCWSTDEGVRIRAHFLNFVPVDSCRLVLSASALHATSKVFVEIQFSEIKYTLNFYMEELESKIMLETRVLLVHVLELRHSIE